MSPWWVREFERMRPQLAAFVRQRSSFEPGVEDDVVAGAALEIAERLAPPATERYPVSWALEEAPPAQAVAEFRALVWTICRRRLHDRLRSFYTQRAAQQLSPPDREAAGVSAEEHAAARELLRMVAAYIGRLSVADRELLLRGLDPDRHTWPLSSTERVRLSRIRRRIASLANQQPARKGQ